MTKLYGIEIDEKNLWKETPIKLNGEFKVTLKMIYDAVEKHERSAEVNRAMLPWYFKDLYRRSGL